MILSNSSSLTLISLRLIVELDITDIGKVVSMFIAEHFEAKKKSTEGVSFRFQLWFYFILYLVMVESRVFSYYCQKSSI